MQRSFYYILLIGLLSLISLESKSQECYIVKETSGVAVYEDASDWVNWNQNDLVPNCSVYKKDIPNQLVKYLYKGDIIDVYETKGDWAKVKVTNDYYKEVWGWVNKNELIYNPKKETDFKKEFVQFKKKIVEFYNNNTKLFWELVIGFILFIFIIIFIDRLTSRCKECGKWGAIKLVGSNKKLKDVVSTTIEKSEQLTDIYGKKHTNYYHVPATKKIYDHLDKYECKYCGNKTEKDYTTSDTKAD